MKQYTKKEIEDYVTNLWAKDSGYAYSNFECRIPIHEPDMVNFEVTRQYEYVKLNFKLLKQIAEFFETDNISESHYSSSGCPTCDYGSTYTVDITVKAEED